MTAHQKRNYMISDFDACVQAQLDLGGGNIPRDMMEYTVNKQWLAARRYGIPEHLICEYIINKLQGGIRRMRLDLYGNAPTFTQRY